MAKEKQQGKEKVNYVAAAKNFLSEVSEESRKVVWPNRESLTQSSLTVLGTLVLLTAIMGVFDLIWGWIFDKII